MENPRVWSLPLLPHELIREILSWLPVKSLLRFRSVCKTWNSFISDPNFVNSHLHKSPKNTDIIISFEGGDLTCDDVTFDTYVVPCSVHSLMENPTCFINEDDCFRLNEGGWIVGSCNGLVCFCLRRDCWDSDFEDSDREDPGVTEFWFRFWNPATAKRSEESPCFRVHWHNYYTDGIWFGFGYDDSCDTYKVAAVHLNHESRELEVEVLNMGENCWRKILSFPAFTFIHQYDGKFLSGTLNWLALRRFNSSYRWDTVTINELVIFSLDLGKETYKHLLLPDGLDEVPKEEPSLAVLRDCLCLSHDYKRTHFVVWQMKEFGVEMSWTQLVNVSYQHLQISILPDRLLLPLCLHVNGDDILLAYLDDLKAILYNRRENRAQSFEIRNAKLWLSADDYVQSLALPI